MDKDFFETALAYFEQHPWEIGKLIVIALVVRVVTKLLLGGYSREQWFREVKARAQEKAGTIAESELDFLRSRTWRRKLWNLVSLLALAGIIAFHEAALRLFDSYGPILLAYWPLLILALFAYVVLRGLNSILNLQLFSKQLRKAREAQAAQQDDKGG